MADDVQLVNKKIEIFFCLSPSEASGLTLRDVRLLIRLIKNVIIVLSLLISIIKMSW